MKIECRSLKKSYRESAEANATPVIRDGNLALESGDCVALLGASGSGKSTLLHCLALLDDADAGEILYDGRDVAQLDEEARARFRLENLGFVFQFHHLIPELSALENVELPASLLGRKARAQAAECLDWVGLGDKLKRFPWQLSGGEQQRVAVARALVNRPRVLFTDEATGKLDRDRAAEILEILLKARRDFGTTLLSVTHDAELAARYAKRYRLKDGLIWALLPGEPS